MLSGEKLDAGWKKRILNNAAEGFFNQSNSSVNSSSVLSVTCSILFGLFFLDRLASLPSVCDEHPYITLPGRVVVSVVAQGRLD